MRELELGEGVGEELGYVEARRDQCGPFVQIRWGLEQRKVVRAADWERFVHRIRRDGYTPEKLADRPGWVRFEIDEGFASDERPVAWTPKALEIPEPVWDRFMEAVGRQVFANLGHLWTGVPGAGRPEGRAVVAGVRVRDDVPPAEDDVRR
ncbi:MAG TPA: hypothetical protein VFV66_32965 [Nonomuraea sp.]|nr:hypothetical protein [Nonomuraea sp.]